MRIVYAAAPKNKAEKPPPMPYKELPLYESPHVDYHNQIADSYKCTDEKVLHSILLPRVKIMRSSVCKAIDGFRQFINEFILMKNEACQVMCQKKTEFVNFMRCPDNASIRQGTVASSALLGMYLGSGTRNLTKKTLGAVTGALCAGALCYPKQTDEIVRNVSYQFYKVGRRLYSVMCRKKYGLYELSCPADLPPKPAPLNKQNQNQEQKNKKCEDESKRDRKTCVIKEIDENEIEID